MPRSEKKSGGKPKRPMTAYACFVQAIREEYRTQKPNDQISFGDLSRECSVRWKNLTDEQKRHFEELADRDKKRFEQDLNDYNLKVSTGEYKQEQDSLTNLNGLPSGSSLRNELDADDFDPTMPFLTNISPKKPVNNKSTQDASSSGGKRRKRKQKKDPNAPKRNISAFFFFCEVERPSVRVEHPEWRVGDISKELSRRWEQLSDKSKFEERARNDKQRYETQINEYHRVKKEQEAAERIRQREAERLAKVNAPGSSQQTSNGKGAKRKKTTDGSQNSTQIGATNVSHPNTNLAEMQAVTVQSNASNPNQQAAMFQNSAVPAGTIMQTMPNSQMAVLNVQMLPGQSHFQVIPFAGQPVTQMNVSMTQPGAPVQQSRAMPMSGNPSHNMMPGQPQAQPHNNMMSPPPAGAGAPPGGMQTGVQVQVQGGPMQVNGPLPVGASSSGPFMPPLYTGMPGPSGMQMVGVPLQFVTAPQAMMSHDGTAFMQIPFQQMHYIPAQHGMQFMPPGVNVGVGQPPQMSGMMTHVGMMAHNGPTLQQLEPMSTAGAGSAGMTTNPNATATANGAE